jgi:hypothetical protein
MVKLTYQSPDMLGFLVAGCCLGVALEPFYNHFDQPCLVLIFLYVGTHTLLVICPAIHFKSGTVAMHKPSPGFSLLSGVGIQE